MTLIIGCISPEFAIIGGDTQLSSGDLSRGRFRRTTHLKVNRVSKDFVIGILGNWSWCYKRDDGNVFQYDEYENLLNRLLLSENADKLVFLKKFIDKNKKIDATAIFIRQKDNEFELGYVSTNGEDEFMKKKKYDEIEVLFNESFFKSKNDVVEIIMDELKQKWNLTNSLTDCLFLVNNVILKLIGIGKNVPIVLPDTPYSEVTNTVGGYITIKILNKDPKISNNLSLCYNWDKYSLLDKITNPFSRIVDQNISVKYIDNLAMLIRSYVSGFNINIRASLFELVNKQIALIIEEKILESKLMNELIIFINEKYKIELPKINLKEEEIVPDFMDIIFGDENELVDSNYLKRFFNN